ncbi:hypothetical protein ACRQU7_01325 [Caproiciproducens sp. R1]
MKNFPPVLVHKWLYTLAVGMGCLGVGVAYYLVTDDGVLLMLSSLVFGLSLVRSILLYRTIFRQDYETVVGTCVAITTLPLRKCRRIKVMDDQGIVNTLLLAKQAKIKIGYQYRFFFKKNVPSYLGSEYFDTVLSTDSFLGYEEIGRYPEKDSDDFSVAKEKAEK